MCGVKANYLDLIILYINQIITQNFINYKT